ncbi:MAG: type IV pilus assembly protein PilM [Acidimicrobiia bacterium]|nr:type IV pilus assembly protein PilM [Acidimicrobiia bacterium]NNK92207.1 type IV pilus assembly protein PilM [Acidimicrobiia bacterium]
MRGAVVDSGRGKYLVRRFGEMPLPPGAVQAGEIFDEDAVAEAVSALFKRFKLPKKRVVIGTANQRVVVRQVDVPQMDESEMKEALPFQVQDSLPIAVEEAVLDYVPLEEFVTPEGEPMQSILVVAIGREVVDSLVRVADAAGVSLAAVDLQPFGLVRAVVSVAPMVGSPTNAVVDIGQSMTQVVIAQGGVARFVRLLPRGGDDFTQALVETLEVDEETAEEMKKTIGVAPAELPDGIDDTSAAQRALTRVADALIEELRGSMSFFRSQGEDVEIEKLIVAGNAARLPHLANRMGRVLGLPIAPAKILDYVETGRVQLSEEELQAAQPILPAAVGLGLWGVGL